MFRRLRLPSRLLAALVVLGSISPSMAQDSEAPQPLNTGADSAVQPQPLQPIPVDGAQPVTRSVGSTNVSDGYCPEGTGDGGANGNGRNGLCGRRNVNDGYEGNCRSWGYGQPDLFYNFYSNPTCGGTGAALYTSPGPVPGHVGQTYVTYQPMMPHELMYPHHRTYHRYYDEGRGLTRSHIHWYNPPGQVCLQAAHYKFKIAR